MAVNFFIDTNIFLSFYERTSDDLAELSKLEGKLGQGELILYLPEQVRDEFHRNREAKIAKAMNDLGKIKFNFSFPRLCSGYEDYEKIRALARECSSAHSSLVQALEGDILKESLIADEVIGRIFDVARPVEATPSLLERARNRMEHGKPPGKSGSLGDAINWETLLSEIPFRESLYLVSNDSDFASPIEKDRFNLYLAKEWQSLKSSEVYYYRTLTGVFKELNVPISLSEEPSKSELIEDLEDSPNFRSTHLAIAKLGEYTREFSRQDLNRLLCALGENPQIGMISHDPDVHEFYIDLIEGRFEDIYRETLETLRPWLGHLESMIEDNFFGADITSLGLQGLAPLIDLDPAAAMSADDDMPF